MAVEKYVDVVGQHRWRVKADNHKTLADSGEGYNNAADRDHGLWLTYQELKAHFEPRTPLADAVSNTIAAGRRGLLD